MAVTKLDQSGICSNEIAELTACCTVLVVNSDTVLQSLVCDLDAEDILGTSFTCANSARAKTFAAD